MKKIIIPDAIKSLGTYNVNIKLHKDVMATLTVRLKQNKSRQGEKPNGRETMVKR